MNEAEYVTMYEAEDSHWWYASLHALVLQSLPKSSDLVIFDAGCGTGRLMQLMQVRGRVSGCDNAPEAVALCGKRGVSNVRMCDLNTTQLPESRYDVITSIDVLYHRAVKDEHLVLKSMHRALKPGGMLIFQVPAYEWLRSEHDEAVHTERRYTRSGVVTMLRDAGLVVEKASYRVGLLFLPIAAIRVFGRRSRNGRGRQNPVSDVTRHSRIVNTLLTKVLLAENALLKHVSLPFGSSVFAIARKPATKPDLKQHIEIPTGCS
jgi:SAM-dependent methyltransferase